MGSGNTNMIQQQQQQQQQPVQHMVLNNFGQQGGQRQPIIVPKVTFSFFFIKTASCDIQVHPLI